MQPVTSRTHNLKGQLPHQYALTRLDHTRRARMGQSGPGPLTWLLTVGGVIAGEGLSSVERLHDPTARSSVLALHDAGRRLGTHLFSDATLYCSGAPCPLCLAACLWARSDGSLRGDHHRHRPGRFEDARFYRALTRPAGERGLTRSATRGPGSMRSRCSPRRASASLVASSPSTERPVPTSPGRWWMRLRRARLQGPGWDTMGA
jgi:tRNA(Arg) A34 adenosine deaminase TadA